MFPRSVCNEYFILVLVQWVGTVISMALLKSDLFTLSREPNVGITEFIVSKGYLPPDKELPQSSLLNSVDNEVTYLLSKLSNEELVELLSRQPYKKEYNLNDIVKISTAVNKLMPHIDSNKQITAFKDIPESLTKYKLQQNQIEKHESGGPVFRLKHMKVEPVTTPNPESLYFGVQTLNNILNSRARENQNDENVQKEQIFDALVTQLKSICCKRPIRVKNIEDKTFKFKSLLNDIMPQADVNKKSLPETQVPHMTMPNEYMFLLINDEIKTNASDDELILVDPDSLGKNSSALLLGPIATPLSNAQLKIVMSRISAELSKLEYQPLLQQISDGKLSDDNIRLLSSLISGPDTRRYIKPHRCNHQSPLARVYGGPKWLICTGYLNLNTPSLYD